MMELITERYEDRLQGILSCFDRMVITGTLPGACYPGGMTSFLYANNIPIFDYPKYALTLRDQIRANAQALGEKHGVSIEHIGKAHIRKEDVVAKVLAKRGDAPGLVHIISAMESCTAYQPWHDKVTHKTALRYDTGKCLHYYFYFMDDTVGLCYLRVPTWCPFRLQFYCNGHSWLAQKMAAEQIDFAAADNAFIRIADFARAQELADSFTPDMLHAILDAYAQVCCPVQAVFGQTYHWSLMQVEYSTDLVFRSAATLGPLYDQISREVVLAVKAPQLMTFLGKKLTPKVAQEIESRLSTRIEGTCIKHRVGPASVKIYDKFKRILRIETTINDVSFFNHHRKVEHRDGSVTREVASLKKSIYSLIDLRGILHGCNQRYLEFLSAQEDHSDGARKLKHLTDPPKKKDGIQPKGVNFFNKNERALLQALQQGQTNIHGVRRADLRPVLPGMSAAGITRQLRRLRQLGIIKRVAKTYRYYLTKIGRAAIAACFHVTEFIITPTLAANHI
jgi:hypothetical protein